MPVTERGAEEDGAPRRHLLHDVVHVVVDHGEVGVDRVAEQLALGLERVGDPQDVVEHVLEVALGVVAERVHLLAEDHLQHVAERDDPAPEQEQLAAQREQVLLQHLLGAPDRLEDAALDGLELVLGVVEGVEVRVDHGVEDRVEQEADGVVALPRALEPLGHVEHVDALVALVGAADRDQPAVGDEDVELGQVTGVAVAGVGDEERMAVVALDLGALSRVAQVLHGQRVQRELVLDLEQLVLGGVDGVDPQHAGPDSRWSEIVGRVVDRGAAAVIVEHRRREHAAL